jgi:hypothetical protein
MTLTHVEGFHTLPGAPADATLRNHGRPYKLAPVTRPIRLTTTAHPVVRSRAVVFVRLPA